MITLHISSSLVVGSMVSLISISSFVSSCAASVGKKAFELSIVEILPQTVTGIILLSNWDSKRSFYDPMCGSGTIPIEALMIAASIPSGMLRNKYAFQKWNKTYTIE